jgi:hypothetical protein
MEKIIRIVKNTLKQQIPAAIIGFTAGKSTVSGKEGDRQFTDPVFI